VLEAPGFLLGEHDDVPGAVSESLKHGTTVQHLSYPVNTMLLIGLACASVDTGGS
jgi:hypothetical protein